MRVEPALSAAVDRANLRRAELPSVAGGLVLVAWAGILIANTASIGFLNPRTVPAMLISLTAVVAALVAVRGAPLRVAGGADAAVLLLAGLATMFVHMYTYLPAGDLGWLTVVMTLGAATVGATAVVTSPVVTQALWLAGVAVAVGCLIAVVLIVRRPAIDVWVFLQQSSDAVRHLQNFYAMSWRDSPGWQSGYPYLPVTTLTLAPFKWLTGDVRIGLIACTVASVALLVRRAPGGYAGPLPALMLFAPGILGLTEESWSEPVLLVYLVAFFVAVDRGRTALGVVFLALALATKQHAVALIPLFACWPMFGLRRTALSVAGAALILLPWWLADPSEFVRGTVTLHYGGAPRTDAPELYTIALQHDLMPPGWLGPLLLAGVLVLVGVAVRRVPRPGHACLLAAVVLIVASLLNKQSFYNQYWLPAELLIAGLCLDSRYASGSGERLGAAAGLPAPVDTLR